MCSLETLQHMDKGILDQTTTHMINSQSSAPSELHIFLYLYMHVYFIFMSVYGYGLAVDGADQFF